MKELAIIARKAIAVGIIGVLVIIGFTVPSLFRTDINVASIVLTVFMIALLTYGSRAMLKFGKATKSFSETENPRDQEKALSSLKSYTTFLMVIGFIWAIILAIAFAVSL